MNQLRTLVLALLAAVATLILSVAPASAHAGLIGSTPADGATVDALPAEVSLEFNEEVRGPAFVVVTGPDGRNHELGEPTIDGPEVTQQIDPERVATLDPNGSWIVSYRVGSADGHPIQGSVSFTVKGAAVPSAEPSTDATSEPSTDASSEPSQEPSTAAQEKSDEASGLSAAPFVIAALAALLVVVVAVQQRSRSSKEKQDP